MFGGDEIKIRRNLVRRWGRWGWQQQQHESEAGAGRAAAAAAASSGKQQLRGRGGAELKVLLWEAKKRLSSDGLL